MLVDEDALGAELTVLGGLGGSGRGLDRASGICGALNALLIYPDEAKRLNRQLVDLEERSPRRYYRVDFEQRIAVTQACAWLSTEGAWQWLLWMLPKRLEPSLRQTSWFMPGWHSWERRGMFWEYDDDFAHWLDHEFWDRLADHRDERFSELAVATDPKASPARLAGLAASEHIEIRDLVAVNPSTPADALSQLVRGRPRYLDREGRVALRVLQNPKVPRRLLEEVADAELRHQSQMVDGDVGFAYLTWAVLHPKAPRRLLARVERELTSGNKSREVLRACIARRPKASPSMLRVLAADPSHEVRASVAQNRKASPSLLADLACDRHRRVRLEVADHAATLPETIASLAHDRVRGVRFAAALHSSTPRAVLDVLTLDDDNDVAAAAATNPATSPEAATAAQRRFIDHVKDWPNSAVCLICEREDTPAELLQQMAEVRHPEVQLCLAAHSRTPAHVLAQIVDDALARDDQDLLEELWCNSTLPASESARVAPALKRLEQRRPRRLTAEAKRLRAARKRARR